MVRIPCPAGWPHSRSALSLDGFLFLFILAVLANLCYCAAYAADLFVQFSGLRASWPRRRWIVLITGIAFAAVLAHFMTIGILAGD